MSIFIKTLKKAKKERDLIEVKQISLSEKKQWINEIYSELALLADQDDQLMDLPSDKFTSEHEAKLTQILSRSSQLMADLTLIESIGVTS